MPRVLHLSLASVLAACASSKGVEPQSPLAGVGLEAPADALAAGDIVEVRVFREDDLNGLYPVAADGTILFPLVGKLTIAGLAQQEVAEIIQHKLKEGYLKEPFVVVLVRERSSLNVHVMGEVKNAGTFPYRLGMNVIEAITKAGGFTHLASKNSVLVTRRQGDGEKVFEVRAGDIGDGRVSNFDLQPGDIVNVPETLF